MSTKEYQHEWKKMQDVPATVAATMIEPMVRAYAAERWGDSESRMIACSRLPRARFGCDLPFRWSVGYETKCLPSGREESIISVNIGGDQVSESRFPQDVLIDIAEYIVCEANDAEDARRYLEAAGLSYMFSDEELRTGTVITDGPID